MGFDVLAGDDEDKEEIKGTDAKTQKKKQPKAAGGSLNNVCMCGSSLLSMSMNQHCRLVCSQITGVDM